MRENARSGQRARRRALNRAVNAYARRLQAAGPNAVGFFYYSGHGASDGRTNYLIPVDVKTTVTGELWDESLQLSEVTGAKDGIANNHNLKAETLEGLLKQRDVEHLAF